ncbi:MAG: hypothetical protein ACTSRG_23455 [Candidatus Helarchaeota archaeon]
MNRCSELGSLVLLRGLLQVTGVLNFSIHNRYKGCEKCVWRERDRGEKVKAP